MWVMRKTLVWHIVIPLIVIASLLSANVLRLVLWTLMVVGLVAFVRTARTIGESRALAAHLGGARSQPCSTFSAPPVEDRSLANTRARITRPDLVAGLDIRRCLVIDLKTTGGPLDLTADKRAAAATALTTWRTHLEVTGFRVEGTWLLVVSTTRSAWRPPQPECDQPSKFFATVTSCGCHQPPRLASN